MFRPNTVGWFNLVVSLLVTTAIPLAPLAAQVPAAPALPPVPQPLLPPPVSTGQGPQIVPPTTTNPGNDGRSVLPPPPPAPDPVTPGTPGAPVVRDGAASQLSGRPSLAHEALNRAIESHRRGDFEAAAPLFEEASRRLSGLTSTEQRELTQFMQDNSIALRARREGAQNLRLAEKALREGRTIEGQELLRKVAQNEQYLAPTDHQHFHALFSPGRTRSDLTLTGATTPTPAAQQSVPDPALLARESLKQARLLLAQFQFEMAEQLANDADHLNQTYARGDDTPRDVLKDVAKARNDPKILLSAARAALQRSDYDQAERYANLSNRVSSSWSLNLFGDSPTKVLKDVAAARAKAVASGPQSPFPTAPASSTAAGPGGDLKPGLSDNSATSGLKPPYPSEPARTLAAMTTASATTPNPSPGPQPLVTAQSSPVPNSLLVNPSVAPGNQGPTLQPPGNVQVAMNPPNPTPPPGNPALTLAGDSAFSPASPSTGVGGSPGAVGPDETENARSLVVQARAALQSGNFAAAKRLNDQARSLRSNLFWWEDNPAKVAADIMRLEGQVTPVGAVTKSGSPARPVTGQEAKEEAVALLQKGRVQLDEGKLDEGFATLLKIRTLNVTQWGLFEYNPDKLRQDLEKARIKRDQEESVKVLAEARRLLEKGDYDNAIRAAYRAQKLHGPYSRWDMAVWADRPSKVLSDVETAKQKQYRAFAGNNGTGTGPAGVTSTDKKISTGTPKDNVASTNQGQGVGTSGGPQMQNPAPTGPAAGSGQVAAGSSGGPAPPPLASYSAAERAQQARLYLADARNAIQRGNLKRARELAKYVADMGVVLNQPGDDSPEAIYRELDRLASSQPTPPGTLANPTNPTNSANSSVPSTPAGPSSQAGTPASPLGVAQNPLTSPTQPQLRNPDPTPPITTTSGMPASTGLINPGVATLRDPGTPNDGWGAKPPLPGPNGLIKNVTLPDQRPTAGLVDQKAQALALLAQARALENEHRLIEARLKAEAAQALHAPFGPLEDSPELALQQLAGGALKRTDYLIHEATELAGHGTGAAVERFARAEQMLAEARQLTLAFGQDVQPVDSRITWLADLRARNEAPGNASVSNGNPPKGPQTRGQALLADARKDFKAGNTVGARNIAMEACQESYGVRDEAMALLRTIDAEENMRRALDVRRACDAAHQAYNRRDYNHAATILASIDAHLLDAERRNWLKNIMNTPEMIEATQAQVVQLGGVAEREQPGRVSDVPGVPPLPFPNNATGQNLNQGPATPLPGEVRVTDHPKPSLLEATQAMQVVQFQKLRVDGLKAMSDAAEKFRVGQTEEALVTLQTYLGDLADTQLDPAKISMLRRPVESRLEQFRLMKAQVDFKNAQGEKKGKYEAVMSSLARTEARKQEQIAELMKQFTAFYKEGKYPEAMSVASKVLELDPDNAVAAAGRQIAKNQMNIANADKIKHDREDLWLKGIQDADKEGPSDIWEKDLSIDKKRWDERVSKRGLMSISSLHKTEKDKEIESRLNTPVSLNFTGTPLSQVVDDLRHIYGINIWVDTQAVLDAGVSMDQRVTIKLDQIALKTALAFLMKSSRLTYVVKEGVVQITTEQAAQGRQVTVSYLVADLVIPVENYGTVGASPFTNTPQNVPQMQYGQPSPLEPGLNMMGGNSVGTPTPTYSPGSPPSSNNGGGSPGAITRHGPTNTQERLLIDLITKTIAPHSWDTSNGAGSIDYHPLTMALVVNQSPAIQEEIADLLAALRRLQDQEVAVEVKVVSISDDFYEVMGVNFNVNIPTNSAGLATAIAGGYQPRNLIAGITPAGSLTNDLSIPITNNSFNNAFLPFFSGPQAAFPGLGGVQMGLAFLSDIQVYLFMEAAQSDVRTNVMQAPKVTLFNGQTATLSVTESQPYVGNISVFNVNGQVIFQPQIQPLQTFVNLTIQAVISADRRDARMSINPQFQVFVPGAPTYAPVVVPVFPVAGLPGQPPQPIIFTQYIQTPTTQAIQVATTVAVPDGGTVVMGGLKTVSESRSEYGPPILSEIPYINRLFKNVSYGRESSSLLIMVTPRIIIMEEEQEYQTGYVQPLSTSDR